MVSWISVANLAFILLGVYYSRPNGASGNPLLVRDPLLVRKPLLVRNPLLVVKNEIGKAIFQLFNLHPKKLKQVSSEGVKREDENLKFEAAILKFEAAKWKFEAEKWKYEAEKWKFEAEKVKSDNEKLAKANQELANANKERDIEMESAKEQIKEGDIEMESGESELEPGISHATSDHARGITIHEAKYATRRKIYFKDGIWDQYNFIAHPAITWSGVLDITAELVGQPEVVFDSEMHGYIAARTIGGMVTTVGFTRLRPSCPHSKPCDAGKNKYISRIRVLENDKITIIVVMKQLPNSEGTMTPKVTTTLSFTGPDNSIEIFVVKGLSEGDKQV